MSQVYMVVIGVMVCSHFGLYLMARSDPIRFLIVPSFPHTMRKGSLVLDGCHIHVRKSWFLFISCLLAPEFTCSPFAFAPCIPFA